MRAYAVALEMPEWQRLRRRFAGAPVLRPKEGHPQLQAADVLAYEMAVNLRRMFVPGTPQKRRRSWDALINHYWAESRSVGLPLLRFASFHLTPTYDPSLLPPSWAELFPPS